MSTPNSNNTNVNKPVPAASKGNKPSYVSSSGNVLESPPLTARLSRLSDTIYNALGLYIVSLFSLDPYAAAQNSQFNTQGRPNAYQERARWGGVNRSGGTGAGWGWGGNGAGGRGGGGGGSGGAGGGSGGGRRIGTVDDVRGPECGAGGCG